MAFPVAVPFATRLCSSFDQEVEALSPHYESGMAFGLALANRMGRSDGILVPNLGLERSQML